MKLILGQPVDKISVESPIVFGGIQWHGCLIGGRDILGVMSDFDLIYIKFGIVVEYD